MNLEGEIDKEVESVQCLEMLIKMLKEHISEANESISNIEECLKTNDSILTKTEKEFFNRELEELGAYKSVKESLLSIFVKHYESYKPMESDEDILYLAILDMKNNEEHKAICKKAHELGVFE